jgi:hypothetical protein
MESEAAQWKQIYHYAGRHGEGWYGPMLDKMMGKPDVGREPKDPSPTMWNAPRASVIFVPSTNRHALTAADLNATEGKKNLPFASGNVYRDSSCSSWAM